MKKRWWALGAAAILMPVALVKPGKPRDLSDFTGKTYAHRGLHGPGVPENSLPAFRRAAQKGVGVELDVQLTRDGVPVVFHDQSLLRMCGVDRRVCDLSYEELKAYPLQGSSEVIPTFRQVLDVLGGNAAHLRNQNLPLEYRPDCVRKGESAAGNVPRAELCRIV